MTHVAPLPCQWNSTKHRVTVSVPQKNLCVDDTGPGPTLTLLALAGFWNRFPTSLIYLNFVAPHLVVFYFSDRGDYRALLQLNYHPIGARTQLFRLMLYLATFPRPVDVTNWRKALLCNLKKSRLLTRWRVPRSDLTMLWSKVWIFWYLIWNLVFIGQQGGAVLLHLQLLGAQGQDIQSSRWGSLLPYTLLEKF